jgi:CRISPR-associated protein Csm5
MTQLQQWRLAITPLSPVHLGSGQDYEPTGYVIDEGALFEFDGIAALQVLPGVERERLGKILAGRPTQDMLLQVQAFFYANRERLIAASRNQVRVNPTVEAFYGERIGKVAQHETGGRTVQNRLEIERTAYNPPTGRPIIPGSALKGAIRTALLDQVNAGASLAGDLRGDKRANQKLQERLFRYQMRELDRDPMRLVRLSDAAVSDTEGFATEVCFAVNRKKQPVMKGDVLVQSQAEQKNLYQLLECLPGMQPRVFAGELSIQGDGGLETAKWPELRFRLPEIAVACNGFFRPILDHELSLLRQRGYLDAGWAEQVQTLLRGALGQALDEHRAFLLRVGRHSGAESVTLNGLRNIKIMKGKGERPEYLDAAKTVWLASNERQAQRNLLPFGWLLVEPHRDTGELAPWPLETGDAGTGQWRTAIRARQAGLRAQAEDMNRREAARQREAEQAQREEEERAARLASLSEEARKLEHLRELLARDRAANRKEAGGELANQLVGLLKEAEESWQGPDCAALADLAVAIYGFIGWPAAKKKRLRQEQIEAVRSKAL